MTKVTITYSVILLAKVAVLLVSYQDMSWRSTACRNSHRTRPICKVIVLQKYPVFRQIYHLHNSLTLPTGCVALWQSFLHSSHFFHKHYSYVCVRSFSTLSCVSSTFGFSNIFLFNISIFILSKKSYCCSNITRICTNMSLMLSNYFFSIFAFSSCPRIFKKIIQ
jgi:hypothetical protein